MTESTREHQDDHEQHGGVGLYIFVFIALCVLTSMSFLTYFDFWREHISVGLSRVFMIGIACTKAMLVILFFMHLISETSWKWMLTVPASLMSIFLVCALIPDIGLRMRHASYERMIHAAEEPAASDHETGATTNKHDSTAHH